MVIAFFTIVNIVGISLGIEISWLKHQNLFLKFDGIYTNHSILHIMKIVFELCIKTNPRSYHGLASYKHPHSLRKREGSMH